MPLDFDATRPQGLETPSWWETRDIDAQDIADLIEKGYDLQVSVPAVPGLVLHCDGEWCRAKLLGMPPGTKVPVRVNDKLMTVTLAL